MGFKFSILSASLLLATGMNVANANEISFSKSADKSADTLVLFYGKDDQSDAFKTINKKSGGQLEKAIANQSFEGDYGNFLEVLAPHNVSYQRVIIAGLGEKDELSKDKVTKLGGNLVGELSSKHIKEVTIATDGVGAKNHEFAAQLAHGSSLRSHQFTKYMSTKPEVKSISFDVESTKKAKKAYKKFKAIEKGVFLARDLTSEVATEMTPVDFANAAKELSKLGVEIKILEPKQLKELGMGALEAVGRGSAEGARLVVAHYKGNSDAPVALVGKGITFDSGGYSIKTGSSIARMKSDMAGAAAVLGTVKVMAELKADVNVVAVMGMAANMVSQTSVAPGDVVVTAEGKSVEILNTDAEGRLVLSDAMWYAREFFKPSVMVDVATLTGSKVRAVGNDFAAVFSDDDKLVEELTFAGKKVNENLWRLPLHYKEKLKSDIADIQNIGSGGPGASTAASFLQHFSGDTKWAHIDIAGNALSSSASGEVAKGGTGYGVRLLSEWLLTK